MVIKRKVNYKDNDELLFEAQSTIALRCTKANGRFFIAHLLDDVPTSMLDDSTATVNVLYYDKKRNGKFKLRNYDVAPVRSIICVIDLNQVNENEYELPRRYLHRINRVLNCVASGKDIAKALTRPIKRQKLHIDESKKPKNNKSKNPQVIQAPSAIKHAVVPKFPRLNPRTGLSTCIGRVEKEVVAFEMHGNHGFREWVYVNDVFSSSKEVIRAVLTKNYALLESLTTPNSPHIKYMHSLFAYRSVGIKKCALEYAIEISDIKAIKLLLATRGQEFKFAPEPTITLLKVMNDIDSLESSKKSSKARNGILPLIQELNYNAIVSEANNYHKVSTALWMKSYDILSMFYPEDQLIESAPLIIRKFFECGNVEMVVKLIEILLRNAQSGYTPLHLQTLKPTPIGFASKEAVLKESTYGVTPLHLAALSPYPTHLEQFLKIIDGTDVNCRDWSLWNPIHFAAVSPSPASMRLLLAANADINAQPAQGSPLHLACEYGRLDTLKVLLEHIPKDKLPEYLESYNYSGYYPIHIAAKQGFTSMVNLLVEYGAKICGVTKADDSKMTALAIAAEAGHLECVISLLDHGAPVDVEDATLRTPLIYAVMNGHAEITRELLNHNANANAADKSNNTVMHYAASYGWLSCVKLLQSIGAERWSLNAAGMSPQVCASLLCRYDVSHFLLDYLNDQPIDYKNNDGATPLFLQCQYGYSVNEILFLLSKNASPNCCTNAKLFPLQQMLLRIEKATAEEKPLLVEIAYQLVGYGAHTRRTEFEINNSPRILATKSYKTFDMITRNMRVDDDVWIAAIKSPDRQEIFETLINSYYWISNGGPVLHAVAATCQLDPMPPQLFLQLLSKMRDIENAFLYYDNNGYVPIFTLVQGLRTLVGKVRKTNDYIARDLASSELFKIYLERTKDITQLVRIGALINGERTATTENLLHIAARHPSEAADSSGHLEAWEGLNILATLLESKWPLDQINAEYCGSTPLELAVASGNATGAAKLIAMGADLRRDSDTYTSKLLVSAVKSKNPKLVELLINHGAKLSVITENSQESILHLAFKVPRPNAACVKRLLDAGADVCALDSIGRTPLAAAIAGNQTVNSTKVFEGNLDYGSTENAPMNDDFDFACSTSDTTTAQSDDALELLLCAENIAQAIVMPDKCYKTCFDYAGQNHDIHLQRIVRRACNNRVTLPHKECFSSFEAVYSLIATTSWGTAYTFMTNLVDFNQTTQLHQLDENGGTLLHFFARKCPQFDINARTIAWLLVEAGLDVAAVNSKQQTALHLAASLGNLPLCRFLLHHAPQLLDQLTIDGNSPLLETLSTTDGVSIATQAIIFFLRQGADINIKNQSGHSVVSLYVDRFVESYCCDSEKFVRVTQRLLERGADGNGLFSTTYGNICSRHGSVIPRLTLLMRVLYISSSYFRQELLVLLLAYQCNRMEVDDEGNTALHHAIALNLTEEVKILLQQQVLFDNGDCVAKQCELSTDQLRAFVNVQNKFGESPLHIAVRPKHEGSFENTEIVLMLMDVGAKLDTVDKDGKTPVDLAMEQPSGVMYTALTKKVLPKSISIRQFADIPDIAKDAAAFMSKSQALGYIKSTPYLPKLIQSSSGSNVYVHPLTGKVYDAPMISVESTADHSIINTFYRMQIVCDAKKFNLITQSSQNGTVAHYDSTAYLNISKAMEAFHKIFKDKTGNDFVSEQYTNIPGKFITMQLPATIKEYDDLVLAPFTVGDATCSLPLPVQQALHQIVNINNLNTALTNKFSSTTTLTLAELQPPLLQDAINLLTTIRSLIISKDTMLSTLKRTPSQELQEQLIGMIYAVAQKSVDYFELIRRLDAIQLPLLDITTIDDEMVQIKHLLEIANANQIILAAKQSTLHPLEYCYKALQISLEECSLAEFDAISPYFSNPFIKKFKVARVFKLARRAEVDLSAKSTILLWHGTSEVPLMQTLQNGLHPTSFNGSSRQGITFHDTSGGCLDAISTNVSNPSQYLLLCQVDLGTLDNANGEPNSSFIPGRYQPNTKDTIVHSALGTCKVPLGQVEHGFHSRYSWFVRTLVTSHSQCNCSCCTPKPSKPLLPSAKQLLLSFAATNDPKIIITDMAIVDKFDIFPYDAKQLAPIQMTIELTKKLHYPCGSWSLMECQVTLLGKKDIPCSHYRLRGFLYGFADKSAIHAQDYKLWHEGVGPLYSQYIVQSDSQVQMKYLVEIEQTA